MIVNYVAWGTFGLLGVLLGDLLEAIEGKGSCKCRINGTKKSFMIVNNVDRGSFAKKGFMIVNNVAGREISY